MKNLLAIAFGLSAGVLFGSRRACKGGPIGQLYLKPQALASIVCLQDYRPKQTTEPDRCTGQTTRLIDAAIQTLFTEGEVTVRDHVDRPANHKMVYEKVVARLKLEHRRELFVTLEHRLKIILPKFCKPQ
ncbi:MAG: hypothetical protein ACRYFV_13655 [Janthinobacterium lividum]